MTEEVISALGANTATAETCAAAHVAPQSAGDETALRGADALPAEDGDEMPALPETRPQRGTDLRAHFDALCAQSEALREEFPDFSLAEALREPDFLRLTSPLGGVSVRAAWCALHADDIARDAQKRVIDSVSSGALRPREGGERSRMPALGAADARSMPRSEREALKERIRAAAARGEKVYPGL